jgi:hypothetical protein
VTNLINNDLAFSIILQILKKRHHRFKTKLCRCADTNISSLRKHEIGTTTDQDLRLYCKNIKIEFHHSYNHLFMCDGRSDYKLIAATSPSNNSQCFTYLLHLHSTLSFQGSTYYVNVYDCGGIVHGPFYETVRKALISEI